MLETLIDTIAESLDIDPSTLTIDSSNETVEQWDSLGHLRLLMAVEDKFDIQFKTSDFATLTSIKIILDKLSGTS